MDHDSDVRAIMRAIPDWVFQLRSKEALATFIVSTIATWIVASIFGLWRGILYYVESMYWTAASVVRSIGDAVAFAFSPVWGVVRFVDWVAFQFEGVIVQLGVVAPIAATLGWIAVIVLVAIVVNVVVGLLSTYLPLRSLPFVGGFFR